MDVLAGAVRANDAAAVRTALEAHPEVRSQLDDALPGAGFGETALLHAVRHDYREVIEALLAAGASIHQKSHWWAGPFGVLDATGAPVDYLESRGAILDAYAASRHGLLERLRSIVAADPAAVHQRGGDGQTPLHVAASVEIAAFLLERGADIDALDVDHESTPAQYLVREHPGVARYLVSRGSRADILLAAALGDLGRVRAFLDSDPASIRTAVTPACFPMRDPRAGGTIYIWTLGSGKGPHAVAAEFGHAEVLALLLERSAPELQLAVQCELGNAAAAKALLEDDPGLLGRIPPQDGFRLPAAARESRNAPLELMLECGWPVDAAGEHGGTALHWSAWHGNVPAVRALLARGASIEALDASYRATPLQWAFHGSQQGWLRDSGDYGETVKSLLAAGARVPGDPGTVQASDAVKRALREYSPKG